MPPPKDYAHVLRGPGDYEMTSVVHNDTYPAIDPTKADLSGKAVFVVGASKGLGVAMCISFAKAGTSMIAIGARSDLSGTVKKMQEAAASVGKPAPKILPLKLDVSSRESVEKAAAAIKGEFGRLDIIIHNAAILEMATILDGNPGEWWRIWEVNVQGPYLALRALVPLMMEGGLKTFVLISSVGAHLSVPGLSAYQTSKLAGTRLMEFACSEHGDKGLLAYSIHPGNIATEMIDISTLDAALQPGCPCAYNYIAVFVDTAELTADSLVYLTKDKREWLAGRYINLTWDLPELMEKKDEIVAGDKLKVKLDI